MEVYESYETCMFVHLIYQAQVTFLKATVTFASKRKFIHIFVIPIYTCLFIYFFIPILSCSRHEFVHQNSDLLVCSSLYCCACAIFHFPVTDSILSTVNSSAILYLNSFGTLGWIPSVPDDLLPDILSVSSKTSPF